jgi:uncharacterized membrane protein
MQTSNDIEIAGPWERVFQLAAELAEWPVLLPHYRSMHILDCSARHKIADFRAVRPFWFGLRFPVRWRARQDLFPEERRITFTHIGGITKGMRVQWRLTSTERGVHVVIEHELTYPIPLLGPLFAEYIVGRIFVHHIASRTLRCFQAMIEAEGNPM